MQKPKTKVRLAGVNHDPNRPDSLRVLMISVTGAMGGAEHSFIEVLRALPRNRVQPYACVPPDSPLERLCRAAEVPVYSVHLRRFRRTTNPFVLAGQVKALYQGSRVVGEICASRDIDLIHANNDTAALVAWEVSRITKIPFVWHCRDLAPMHGFGRILSGAAAGVVAISRRVEQDLLKEGVAPERVHRIDNGIDLKRIPYAEQCAEFRTRVRARLGIDMNRPMVLCVGSFVPWKRLELFLDTLAELRRRIPDVLGLLAGSDLISDNAHYAEALTVHAQALGLDQNSLRFLGECDDVPELMTASDVVVSCSENEPFGRVVAEAGAAGIPVVSTRSGGKVDILEDGVTGLLVEQGDTMAMADACVRLLNDAELRKKFGAAARLRVEKLFDVRRTAEDVTQLFERITGRREASESSGASRASGATDV
jgi:glycosyltransferase involved in cell wall biosynthesis